MSLSISSSEPTAAAVTTAGKATVPGGRYAAVEQRWAWRLCLISPLLAGVAVPLIHRYMLWFLYLKPVSSTWQISQAFHSRVAIGVVVAAATLPWLWLLGLKAESLLKSRIPWALIIAVCSIGTGAFFLTTYRATWFFVEWAVIRTPNPSFARNTLYWEQRNFQYTDSDTATARVGLIGSSQTNQGFDLGQLQAACPHLEFEKNCLAGFGPLQYAFLGARIRERNFQHIVCHLSEFDFYREDTVPLSRLHWAASLSGTAALSAALTPTQRWQDRSALADLVFAAVVPLWRQRDHFRRTLFGYWWRKCDPPADDNGQPDRLADTPALQQAIAYLKQNIGHKRMVEANFAAFRAFSEDLRGQNVGLIVLEGLVHPEARAGYDTDNLQQATRSRLTQMAAECGFLYLNRSQMPKFTATDFADAYHLNQHGRDKLTQFLAVKLNQNPQGTLSLTALLTDQTQSDLLRDN